MWQHCHNIKQQTNKNKLKNPSKQKIKDKQKDIGMNMEFIVDEITPFISNDIEFHRKSLKIIGKVICKYYFVDNSTLFNVNSQVG